MCSHPPSVLDCIKNRDEVHKEDPGKVARGIQLLEEEVQQAGHSFLCAHLSLKANWRGSSCGEAACPGTS